MLKNIALAIFVAFTRAQEMTFEQVGELFEPANSGTEAV